ncbi:MAG: M4 family metallopeptidase, partial [Acidobacteriota bacterium]|nr:M4 family metallopeptidase [Acidobacteriota bacterium]
EAVDLLNGADGEGGSNNNQPTSYTIVGGQYVPSDGGVRWRVGEDVQGLNQPPAGILRDMWTPPAFGNPDKLTSENYHCATSDGGGVHANSGVPNHAFAMLVDGKTFNGQTIAPIGLTRAAAIYWRAESVYQTPTTNFAVHDQAIQTSCSDLIGVPLKNLSTISATGTTSADVITLSTCQQVAKAMLAVEMSTPPTQCGFQPLLNPETPATCPDSATVFAENWEDGDTMGWTLTSTGVNTEWPGTNWAVRDNLPEGRTGKAAFAVDSRGGTCAPGGDYSGQFTIASPVITIPAGATSARLNFDHYVETELEFDGGQLEYKVGTGAWTLMPQQRYTFNAPASRLDDPPPLGQNTNPNAGEFAWHGANGGSVSGSWGTTIVNLAPLVQPGQTIQLRWNFSQDGCNGTTGWFVDNIRVYDCPSGGDPNPTPTPGVPPAVLHFHGNTHASDTTGTGQCTGTGTADLVNCGGPFLKTDIVLDTAPAARFTIPNPALNGTNARTIHDPNWIWNSGPVRLGGEMTLEWWASCGACGPTGAANWNIRIWADYVPGATGDTAEFIQTVTATPALPNVPSKLTAKVFLPAINANSNIVLHIDPVFVDSQNNTNIYYDSQLPCPGSTGSAPCDSVAVMPVLCAGCPEPTPTPVPTPTPGPTPSGAGPRYLNYNPPPGVGTGAGEPTLGANWDTGKVMY